MDEKLAAIFARRSIRGYTPGEITETHVRALLEAGMAAPSAVCKDPWRFVVVKEPRRLAALADGLPNGKMLAHAGVGLIVAGDLREAHDHQLSYLLQDCSAAIENILIAASTLGLGACWLGVHPREERIAHVRDLVGLPSDIVPVSIIAVGWPAEEKPPRTRFAESRVHYETW